jgi:predicted dehydrogenase
MKARPKVAVIGLGMGKGHAKSVAESGKADLVALCDVNIARLAPLAKQFGVSAAYTDWKKMLREVKPDVAIVALPNYLHAPVTIAALNAGAHVLCEKPMALNTRQAQSMADVAKAKRKKLMINFSYRFTREARALKEVVDKGTVGEIYYGRTQWHRNRGIPGFGGWFGQKKLSGGGPLIDLGVHRIDLALWLMGNPKPVTVSGSTYNHIGTSLARRARKQFDVEDLAAALIRFENGATLLVEISWALNCEHKDEMVTHLYGTKAGICHRNIGEGYAFVAHVFGEWDGTYVRSELTKLPPALDSVQHFIDVVVDGSEPITTPEDGINVMRVLDGVYKSAKLGKEIQIPAR